MSFRIYIYYSIFVTKCSTFCNEMDRSDEAKDVAAERRELETREEAIRDTGREVGLSLDQGRTVLGREREKLRDEAEHLGKVRDRCFVRHDSRVSCAGGVCVPDVFVIVFFFLSFRFFFFSFLASDGWVCTNIA